VKWAVETYKPEKLILFGQSDGAMLATALALRLVANDATVCCLLLIGKRSPWRPFNWSGSLSPEPGANNK
jgi:surfactin synthase thioesterase subunit